MAEHNEEASSDVEGRYWKRETRRKKEKALHWGKFLLKRFSRKDQRKKERKIKGKKSKNKKIRKIRKNQIQFLVS